LPDHGRALTLPGPYLLGIISTGRRDVAVTDALTTQEHIEPTGLVATHRVFAAEQIPWFLIADGIRPSAITYWTQIDELYLPL
jgi:hypothetical protein